MSLTGCSERIYSFKVVWHVGVECVEETSARKWYVFVSRNTGLRHMPVTIDANSSGYFDCSRTLIPVEISTRNNRCE